MKHISPLLITLFALCIGVANVWAETKTETITFTDKDWSPWTSITSGSSFESANNARGVANNGVSGSCKSPKEYQNITKIELVCSSNTTGGSVAVLVGTSQVGSQAIKNSNNATYIYNVSNLSGLVTIKVSKPTSKTVWVKSIAITYETSSSCTKPTFTIEDKTITLEEASNLFDMSTITTDKDGSTGAITYTCSDETNVDIDGSTFYTETPGTYTITATMAADDTYCEATTTFTITVQSAPCTKLDAPMGLNASATAYDAATLTWDAVENATKYQITITPPAFGGSKTLTTTGTETTYAATDLSPETKYTWTVKAIGNGSAYCDSEKSAEGIFTTPAKPKYTITWSTPAGENTTQVTQGDKVILPTTNPEAPQGCSDKVFVGWSATNIGTTGIDKAPDFITAETVPTGDVTYYAVFATKEGSGVEGWTLVTSESDLVAGQIYTLGSSPTPNSGKVLGAKATNNYSEADWTSASTIPTKLTLDGSTNAWTFNDGTGYLYAASSGSNYLKTQTPNDKNGQWSITFSSNAAIIKAQGTNTRNLIRYNSSSKLFSCYASGQSAVYLFRYSAGSTYTDYVTNCVECTNPTTPLALSVAETTLNLGEDGTAKTIFSTTGGNGAEIVYSLTPEVGSAISDDVLTFTQAGTYTLTAQQDLNTTDGAIYCGSRVSQTITVTKNPVFEAATIDKNSFEVNCGDTTSMNSAAVITMGTNYNLTKSITITAPEGFLVSTNKTDKTKYTASVTLTPAASGDKIGKITANVYVRAYSAIARADGYTGEITIAGDEINTQKIAISSTVTCKEYTLTFVDRGATYATKNLYAGAELKQSEFPADPTGVCTEPINYVFDGWATAEVANGSTTYTPVSFPYTMPKGNTTLYAVYRYVEEKNNDFQIADADVDLEDGKDCILTAQSSNAEYALSSVASTDVAGRMTTKEVAVDEDDVVAYKIQNVTDNTIIWTLEGNASDGYSFLNKSTGTYLTTTSGTLSLGASANTKYTISHPVSDDWRVEVQRKGSSNYLSGYKAGEVLFSDYSKSTLNLYLYGRAYSYTTSPVCGPYIKATGDVAITSGKDIWVESVTPLTISAKNLDKNEDGAAVTITAIVTDDAAAKGFSIKTPGTQNSGAKSVTLASSLADATFDGALTVVYTPKEADVTEEGKIALRVYKSGGSTTYATDTIVVRGRSLPVEFVIVAETKNGWVALPSDLDVSSTGKLKYPYAISVDDDAAPTKATEAPKTAVWSADARSIVNAAATAIRLKNAQGQHLQGSTAKDETNVWLSNQNSEQTQSWELRSADFEHYFVRMQASEADRYLSYYASEGKIGNYKQESALRILPVEKTCVRFDAPKLDVHTLTSTSVTLRWETIAGVADYEYSLDDGATWQTCTSVQTMGTAIQWTLSELQTEKEYTISVRAKAADGKTNCSDYDSETFTTTSCDDVPTDLWSSSTANSVTIMWNATAATATVKIYSDEKGENEVQTVSNQTSPAKIVGLAPNTKYYFQVLADGSCASAIDDFWTESNEVSIVEWEKEAVIVDINTDVSDADDVSILVENQTTHGSNNKNIADDLFFSKYYEASGVLKLVAIYNGTRDALPLTDVQIKIGFAGWDITVQMNQYGKIKPGYIAPDEEIIVWHKSSKYATNQCVESKMDVSIMEEKTSLSFGGRASIGLFRNGTLIDIIGAGDATAAEEGTCRPSWGDANGWCGSGYNIENNTEEIELSTNRCLLVRSNKVKSGVNAVANNTSTFATLTKDEWLGKQVPDDDDTEETVSCEGFAYVADFNYNDYYTTYDSITKLEIKGNRNPDGTYTIPVERMDTMACTNMRLQLKKAGVVIASREYKVPIVVDQSIDTKNTTYFGGNKLTDEICATCDVVVRDKAQLTHTAGGKQQFRDMYIYAGSRLSIPTEQKMTLDKVRMFAKNDTVSYAIINNGDASDAAISVKEVSHIKRIDGKYWYPFSLPYDCNIADIDQLSGQTLGVYGEDWGIKFYDGKKRQSDGNSTTHYGEVSKYWTMMPEDGVLKAYTGYIIGLFVPAADEALMKSVNFPPATASAYTESAEAKTTPITNWPDNLSAQPRHHGWNFVGSPYISLFGGAKGEGLYNDQLTMGWTDVYGEQQDKEHIYVSIPNGGNSNTYTQAQASGVTIKPFTAYFVQAIDPTNGQSNTLELTYSKANRHLLAPARAQEVAPLILAELDIRCGALHDNAGVLVSDTYSADYEIGDDLYKMYAAEGKPQLYTTDARNDKMAYQALPDLLAHAVPLGIYVPAAGDYTLSLNRSLSRLTMADAVYLLYDGSVVADLLRADYTLSATARGTLSGYTLDIRRAPKMPTYLDQTNGDTPYLILRDGMLTIANLPAEATIQVYDVLGRLLLRTTATEPSLSVPAVQTGVYTVLITTDQQQTVLKTLCR